MPRGKCPSGGQQVGHIVPTFPPRLPVLHHTVLREAKEQKTGGRQEEEVFIVKCLQCSVVRSFEVMLSLDFAMSRNPFRKQNQISWLDVTTQHCIVSTAASLDQLTLTSQHPPKHLVYFNRMLNITASLDDGWDGDVSGETGYKLEKLSIM